MKVTLTQPSPNQVTASGSQAIPDRELKKPAIGSTTGESLRRSPTKIPSPTASGTLITSDTSTRPTLAPMLVQSDPSLSMSQPVLATSAGGGRKIAGSTLARVTSAQAIRISAKGAAPRPTANRLPRHPCIIAAPSPSARWLPPRAGGGGNSPGPPTGRQ